MSEQFFEQFDCLEQQKLESREQLGGEPGKVEFLEQQLGAKNLVIDILKGLKLTLNHERSKDGSVYSFVREITDSRIIGSDNPFLYKPCPRCNEERAVVMEHLQTEDSPMGDTWTRTAYVLCPTDGAYNIARFIFSH